MDGASSQPQKQVFLSKAFDLPMEVPFINIVPKYIEHLVQSIGQALRSHNPMNGALSLSASNGMWIPSMCASCGAPINQGDELSMALTPLGFQPVHISCASGYPTVKVIL